MSFAWSGSGFQPRGLGPLYRDPEAHELACILSHGQTDTKKRTARVENEKRAVLILGGERGCRDPSAHRAALQSLSRLFSPYRQCE